MAKKTIKEFKEIFGGIKKPKRPTGVSGKDKDEIESAVENDNLALFFTKSNDVYKKQPDYFVDLVAYKLAKHVDDGKWKAWLGDIPADARKKVVAKLVPGDITDHATRKVYDKAVADQNYNVIRLISERDPEGVNKLGEMAAYEDKKKQITDALGKGDDKSAKNCGELYLAWFSDDDIMEAAAIDTKRFFATALTGFKDNAKFIERLKDKVSPRQAKKA